MHPTATATRTRRSTVAGPRRDLQEDTTISLTITALSRPATTLAKLAGPLGRGIQDFVTARYLRALG
jgi:uncharacterized protein (UPF0548 family)